MNKKKGSVLLYTILISSILILFSFSLISLIYIENITEYSVIRYERMKLSAESGIERGISLLKQNKGIIPAYPNNIIHYNSYGGSINCTVELSYTACTLTSPGKYIIASKTSSPDGKHTKSITAFVEDTGSFKKDFYIDDVINNSITVVDEILPSGACPIVFKDNSFINLNGILFLQGSNIELNKNNITAYTDIFLKSNDITLTNTSYEKDRVYADIPDEVLHLKDSCFKDAVTKLPINKMNILKFKELEKSVYETGDVLVYKAASNTQNLSISGINSEINSYIKAIPAEGKYISTYIWDALDDTQKSDLSYYMDNIDLTRLLLIDGDLTIDSGVYNNYIIFCSGTVNVKDSPLFNNSSIYCRKLSLDSGSVLTVYPSDRAFLGSRINKLRELLMDNIYGYYDSVEVKIIDLIDG